MSVQSLSARAAAFVSACEFFPYVRDRKKVADILGGQTLPVFESILDFQERFGGFHYEHPKLGFHYEHPKLGEGWSDGCGFTILDIDEPDYDPDRRYCVREAVKIDEIWHFDCGWREESQLALFLDERGVLYQHDVVIASSVEKWIESAALESQMLFQSGCAHRQLGQVSADNTKFESGIELPPIPEAWDVCNRWWGTETIRLHRGRYITQHPIDFLDLYWIRPEAEAEAERLREYLATTARPSFFLP